MRTTAPLLALACIATTIGCAPMTVPPAKQLQIPQVSFGWLARTPVTVVVEVPRVGGKGLNGRQLTDQLRAVLEERLTASGVTVAASAPTAVRLRVQAYELTMGDLAPGSTPKKRIRSWRGCVALLGEISPADPQPVVAEGKQCREGPAEPPTTMLWAAYQAALGEVLTGMAQPSVAHRPSAAALAASSPIPPARPAASPARGVSPSGGSSRASAPSQAAPAVVAAAPAAAASAPAAARNDRWAPLRDQTLLVLDLRNNGVDARVSQLLTTLLLSQLDQVQVEGLRALGADDVNAVLSADRQKELMGCESASCMAEIGGAIGAAIVLHGEVGRIGSQYTISITAMSTKRAAPLARLSELTPTDEDALARALPAATEKLLTRIADRLAENR